MNLSMIERNITVLFEKPLPGIDLKREDLPESFRDAEARAGGIGQLYLSSFRTGIEINFTPERLSVRDGRCDTETDDLMPQLVIIACRKAEASIRAYGLNYKAEFPVKGDKAGRFIAEQLLNLSGIEKELSITGASVQLEHIDGQLRYRLSLEPRWQNVEHDYCYAGLNIHHEGSPPGEEIELKEQVMTGQKWFKDHLTKLFPDLTS